VSTKTAAGQPAQADTTQAAPKSGRWRRRRRSRPDDPGSDVIPIEMYGLKRGTTTVLTLVCVLFALFTLTPIAWIVINSTKTQANIFETFGFWFARRFSLFQNFGVLGNNIEGFGTFGVWFGNSGL
jgi:multiple sugar transport system permease protein